MGDPITEHCSDQAAIPLYVILIGYCAKALLTVIIENWLRKKRYAVQQLLEYPFRDEIPVGGSNDDAANVKSGVETTTPSTTSPGGTHTEYRSRSVRISQWCWTLFKFITPLIQVLIDSIEVNRSASGNVWNRYQCYAVVFSNSPNVGSIVLLCSTALLKLRDREKLPQTEIAAVLLLSGIVVGPLLTHALPFAAAYPWAFAIAAVVWYLTVVITYETLNRVFKLNMDSENNKSHFYHFIIRYAGIVVVLLFATGVPTMILAYKDDLKYMDSLSLIEHDRNPQEFLAHQMKAARWYTLIHYFI